MGYLPNLWTQSGMILTAFIPPRIWMGKLLVVRCIFSKKKNEIENSIKYLQLLFIIKSYRFATSELISVNDRTLSQV